MTVDKPGVAARFGADALSTWAGLPSIDGSPRPGELHLSYLRRKSGQGMVAVYEHAKAHRSGPDDLGPAVTVRVDAMVAGRATVYRFPRDPELAHLPDVVGPHIAAPLRSALVEATSAATGEATVHLAHVRAVPVRYKPGSRCVLRFEVDLARPGTGSGQRVLLYGKLYKKPEDAETAYDLAMRLWNGAGPRSPIPRPLSIVATWGLVLTEAAGTGIEAATMPGTLVLRPKHGSGSRVAGDPPPDVALREAAAIAAWLHDREPPPLTRRRDLASEAAATRRRVRELVVSVPELAAEVIAATSRLSSAMQQVRQCSSVLAHGAYKPSQLVFTADGHAIVTDFDGACLGDPAMDVGCFLAYLRPRGYWSAAPGSRAWFGQARTMFLAGYTESRRRSTAGDLVGVLRRSHLFEAAFLLKIALRRAHRLQSPRPAELRTVLAEVRRSVECYATGCDPA